MHLGIQQSRVKWSRSELSYLDWLLYQPIVASRLHSRYGLLYRPAVASRLHSRYGSEAAGNVSVKILLSLLWQYLYCSIFLFKHQLVSRKIKTKWTSNAIKADSSELCRMRVSVPLCRHRRVRRPFFIARLNARPNATDLDETTAPGCAGLQGCHWSPKGDRSLGSFRFINCLILRLVWSVILLD